jgi:hypothetical protein
MQRLEVSVAVQHIYIYIYMSLGGKGLIKSSQSENLLFKISRTITVSGGLYACGAGNGKLRFRRELKA